MPETTNTEAMVGTFKGLNAEVKSVQDESRRQISVLDAARIPYQDATKNLDISALRDLVPVNQSLVDVRSAYDERIDSQGCRSDLFWRVIGLGTAATTPGPGVTTTYENQYTLRVEQLATVYEKQPNVLGVGTATGDPSSGFSTGAVMKYDSSGTIVTYNLEEQGNSLVSPGSNLDPFYTPDNLHGIKLYDEPYARDTLDTFRSVGVATIGFGNTTNVDHNYMTILSPAADFDVEIGYLGTPNKAGYFAQSSFTVTSVGTTTADLSTYPFTGITTTRPITVPYITIDQFPVGVVTAPLADGDYFEVTFTQDPSTISDQLAIPQTTNPYVNQTIEMMTESRAGAGVSVRYDNSGVGSNKVQWNKFYDGLPDPEQLDQENPPLVSEPPIGAGKVYYRVGFPERPMYGGSPATVGQVVTVTDTTRGLLVSYETLPSCDNTALNSAIATRDDLESQLANDLSSGGKFATKLSTSNGVKKKKSDEFDLRIWAYRTQIGTGDSRVADRDAFVESVSGDGGPVSKCIKDIMDEGPDACGRAFT